MALPTISVPATLRVKEGAPLQIPLTKAGTGPCSVQLRTAGNTAKTKLDYIGYDTAPTVRFAAPQTSATASLTTLPDRAVEGAETLAVYVVNPVGCTVQQGKCVVTIEDAAAKAPAPKPVPKPAPAPPAPTPAAPVFPRAIGFATATPAGVGQRIVRVTNLDDSGPGSLREAVKTPGCVVAFEVGGCIRLNTHLSLDADNVTIAGQTAPGSGITLQTKELQIRASNLRIQHITLERGHDPTNTGNADAVKISPGSATSTFNRSNIHFDHCAFLWATDETVEAWPHAGRLSDITFSDCLFAEPLWRPQKLGYAAHDKVASGKQSEHNYGVLIGFGTKRVDMQHCLFADMYFRTPFIDHGTSVVLANNIMLNVCMGACIHWNADPPPKDPCVVNAQGLLAISGPQSVAHSAFRFHNYPPKWPAGSAVFVGPLYGWKGDNSTVTPGAEATFSRAQPTQGSVDTPVLVKLPPIQPPGASVKAGSAEEIFKRVVTNCGPLPKVATRNPAVARVITKLRTKRGGWVDHETQVGGFSAYPSVYRKLEDAVMPDGTRIPVPVASDAAAVKRWLDVFTGLVSFD